MDVFDLIFPRKCFGCGKEGKYICTLCFSKLKTPGLICPICKISANHGITHFVCKKQSGLSGLVSLWKYDGAIRKAILALKYKFAFDIARELAEISAQKLKEFPYLPKKAILVPVPLHTKRENWRGFNQSEEIGKLIAKDKKWQFIPDLLIRKKLTIPQTELRGEERTKNIKEVFSLNPNQQSPNASVILFDDVWTTGSTLKEACRVLKRSGTKTVWGLTIAR